ncbi:hypothetical protein TNCV_1786311 [Trichonephila clavipes]|nr:hypothetical protein TNCV_1786311 [Trichonephila clavipes]
MADEESVRKVRGMENGEANGGNNTVRDPMDNNCESKFNNTRSFDAKPEGMLDRGRQLSYSVEEFVVIYLFADNILVPWLCGCGSRCTLSSSSGTTEDSSCRGP